MRDSIHKVPLTMYCTMNAVAMTRPPTKPPPGALWPRSRKNTEITPGHRQQQSPSTAGTSMKPRGNESVADRCACRFPRRRSCARGSGMLSGAGRKRRSSLYTASATMPTTVISPMVSKPRKSTRITLTTLRPPPSGSALLQEELREPGRAAAS